MVAGSRPPFSLSLNIAGATPNEVLPRFQDKPAPHRRYPPNIQRLIDALSEAREAVKNATAADLKTAQEECCRLELQWRRYCSKMTPISLCPPEILSRIFCLYLSENPRRVRRLLPVCRQWRDLAINDTQLWNRVYIKVPRKPCHLTSEAESYKKHAQMCLQRGGASLFHIDLDCEELCCSDYEMEMEILQIMEFNRDSDEEEPWDRFGYQQDNIDVLGTKAEFRTLPILDTIKLLIGQSGENMSQWGRLELILPRFDHDNVTEKLWKLFKGPTPQLNRLRISGRGFRSNSTDKLELAGSFPGLQALKHLDVNTIYIFRSLKLNASSIESLVIHEGFEVWSAYSLSQFTYLQHLEICGNHWEAPDERIKVSLPLLRQLNLRGIVRHIGRIQFHTPVLRDINILARYPGDVSDQKCFLPGIQSLHVCWRVSGHSRRRWRDEQLLEEMKGITVHFDKARQLTVSECARNALVATVRLLYQSGELSHDLETIRFEHKSGLVETMDVKTLLNPNSLCDDHSTNPTLKIIAPIQQITGKGGEIMDRWGILWLSLPQFDDELAAKVWKLFNFPAPRLTQLTIRVYGYDHDHSDVAGMTGAFPDLSALKHLDVEALYILRSLTLDHSSIESLVLHQGVVAWPLFQLSRFTQLQTLVVSPEFDLSNPNDELDVTLPVLREIHFIGNVQHLGKVHFHTPILQDIYFVDRSWRDINDISYALPEVQGLHVHWSEVVFRSGGWRGEDLENEIKALMGHFDKAKQFTVSEGAKKALISAVRLLHSCGVLSPDLERIGFQGEGEIVDVQGLLASQE